MLRSLGKYYCSILARSILSTVPLRPIYKGAIKTSLERVKKPNRLLLLLRSFQVSLSLPREAEAKAKKRRLSIIAEGLIFYKEKNLRAFLTLYISHYLKKVNFVRNAKFGILDQCVFFKRPKGQTKVFLSTFSSFQNQMQIRKEQGYNMIKWLSCVVCQMSHLACCCFLFSFFMRLLMKSLHLCLHVEFVLE